MDIKQIKERVTKKEEQIAKIEKKIKKWQDKKNEADYIKEEAPFYSTEPKKIKTIDQLAKARHEVVKDPLDSCKEWVKSNYQGYLKNCDAEIRRATYELDEANKTLTKYKSQLGDKEEKASTKKIKVIMDFLDKWEENVIEYIKENVKLVPKYYKAHDERSSYEFDNRFKVKHGDIDQTEFNKKLKALKEKELDLKQEIHPLSMSFYSSSSKNKLNEEKLKETLDKDKEAKYWNLVKKVEAVTGPITDAKNLKVGRKGDLNGYVIGENGKAEVSTIGAGGYNIQCYHYRTLVHPVK